MKKNYLFTHFLKGMLTLVLLFMASTSWGDNLYSWDGNGNSETANETGATAVAVGDGMTIGAKQKVNWTIKIAKGFNNANYVQIDLAEPLFGGEIITIGAFVTAEPTNAVTLGVDFGTTATQNLFKYDSAETDHATINLVTTNVSPADFTMTVPAEARGSKTIRIYRNGGGTALFVSKFVVEELQSDVNVLQFLPAEGNYESKQDVVVKALKPNTTFYYTTDGSEPTTESTLYESSIPVTTSCTVKVLAVNENFENATAEAKYVIKLARPVVKINGSAISKNTYIAKTTTVSMESPATIHYTTDGKKPTKKSPVYTSEFNVDETTTIRAFAIDEYGNVSDTLSYKLTYTDDVLFNFNTNQYGKGISSNSSNDGDILDSETLTQDGVTISFEKAGSTQPRFWDDATNDIRLRLITTGTTMTIKAPEGMLIRTIDFAGNNIAKMLYTNDEGESVGVSGNQWKQKLASQVTFTLSENNAVRITYIIVKLATPDKTYDIALVAKDGEKYYGTFSSDREVFIPQPATGNVEVSTVTITDGDLKLNNLEEAEMNVDGETVLGFYVTENTGVLIGCTPADGADSNISIIECTGTKIAPLGENMLKPATEEMTGNNKFYKLAYNDYSAKTGLGFYYGAADGAAFTCKEGTAYLAVPQTAAAKATGWAFDSEVTAIKSVAAESATNAAYNLAGQRVKANMKGIVIMNGKKTLNK